MRGFVKSARACARAVAELAAGKYKNKRFCEELAATLQPSLVEIVLQIDPSGTPRTPVAISTSNSFVSTRAHDCGSRIHAVQPGMLQNHPCSRVTHVSHAWAWQVDERGTHTLVMAARIWSKSVPILGPPSPCARLPPNYCPQLGTPSPRNVDPSGTSPYSRLHH